VYNSCNFWCCLNTEKCKLWQECWMDGCQDMHKHICNKIHDYNKHKLNDNPKNQCTYIWHIQMHVLKKVFIKIYHHTTFEECMLNGAVVALLTSWFKYGRLLAHTHIVSITVPLLSCWSVFCALAQLWYTWHLAMSSLWEPESHRIPFCMQ
jgi:hypothetical protein